MKLYHKKLSGMEELQRERKKLQQERDKLKEEEIFSVSNIVGSEGGGMLGTALEFLPLSSPFLKKGVDFVMDRFRSKKTREKDEEPAPSKRKERPTAVDGLKTIAMDVAMSYLKWKAVELSYKALRKMVKARQASRAATSKN